MTKYKKIFFSAQSIIIETEKAVLIKMPSNSIYAGYAFWCSKRLVKNEKGKQNSMSFVYNDDYTFLLKWQGNSTHKKPKRPDEITVSALSMEMAYQKIGC